MKQLRRFWKRARNVVTRQGGERRLREEIEEHLALETEANVRAGMAPRGGQARGGAPVRFGGSGSGELSRGEGPAAGGNDPAGLPVHISYAAEGRGFHDGGGADSGAGYRSERGGLQLVNALMLKSLPVADPKTLIRLGNNNDCCVGIRFHDNGEFSSSPRTAMIPAQERARV